MAANAVAPQVVKAAALNDIGPVVDPSGLNRIATYTGADVRFPDMANARRGVQGMFGAAYPGLDDAGWEDFVQRLFRWDEAARAWVLDYDLNLSLPIKEQAAAAAPPADLWPLYRMLRDKPVLVLRGALSDVLSAEIFERMSEDMPNVTRFAVPNRGHVPLLDEEPAAGAVDAFLAHV
jgi:pimeloyl-ACP methyl ester carboxylesterase